MMLQYRTKGNAEPRGKRRVYFTCHPDDMARYFDKVCEDIFKTHDCAIYYTEDMTAAHDENRGVDLGQMNLFVIPVTFRLLSKPNRAMDEDFKFAQEHQIPVLPLMMETGIDQFYSQSDKFGERQYISPFSSDLTAISYEEKLKKYLESVLISDEMAKRVRAAFDAYIFLSYRKKDRRYANELMRLIHSRPECRDIAIWYDEFLTPGESFKENIEKMLDDSKLFTLLVTPNLLEDSNFVMTTEYPEARRKGMDILPTEMEPTERAELESKYDAIPECLDPHEVVFTDTLIESISKVAVMSNDSDHEHTFLIGLAYFDGIDVEVDKDRGLALITSSAEAEYPEAMAKLYSICYEGVAVKLDYPEALKWALKLVDHYTEENGEKCIESIFWQYSAMLVYNDMGEYCKAKALGEKVYAQLSETVEKTHPLVAFILHNLAVVYGNLGDLDGAKKLQEDLYFFNLNFYGEKFEPTISSLTALGVTCGKLGDYERAKEIQEKAYATCCKELGQDCYTTHIVLNNLASAYGNLGEDEKAKDLYERAYVWCCKNIGEEDPKTLTMLSNLAFTYGKVGDSKKEFELNKNVYRSRRKVLGEDHPDTLASLNNIAYFYGELEEYSIAAELQEKIYGAYCRIFGEDHKETLRMLNNLAATYSNLGELEKARDMHEKVYNCCCRLFGFEHSTTVVSLQNLTVICMLINDPKSIMKILFYLSDNSLRIGKCAQAIEGFAQVYSFRLSTLGADHPDTVEVFEKLNEAKKECGNK